MTTIYKYRWLIYELVVRDLRLRYRGSMLGFGWTLLNPILFMTLYTLVFSVYLRVQIPHYALYLLAGLIPWNWLSGAVLAGTTAIVDGRMYVGRTVFPTAVLPIVPVVSNGINFLFSLPILIVFALLLHVQLGIALLALPVVVIVQAIIVAGATMLIATANVFYRDLQQLANYALTIGFYLTPVFYTRAQVPAAFQPLVTFNPLASLFAAYQNIFYKNAFPDLGDLAYALIFGLVLLGLGFGTFARAQSSFCEFV